MSSPVFFWKSTYTLMQGSWRRIPGPHPDGLKRWSQQSDLNRRPTLYESVALPAELCWLGREERKKLAQGGSASLILPLSRRAALHRPLRLFASFAFDRTNARRQAGPVASASRRSPKSYHRASPVRGSPRISPSWRHPLPQ